MTPATQAARIAWARTKAMAVIPRVASRRPFRDLLTAASREDLLALVAVLADRGTLEAAAHAEVVRAGQHGRQLPESIAEYARDWERKRGARRRAAQEPPRGVLVKIRSDEAARGNATRKGLAA